MRFLAEFNERDAVPAWLLDNEPCPAAAPGLSNPADIEFMVRCAIFQDGDAYRVIGLEEGSIILIAHGRDCVIFAPGLTVSLHPLKTTITGQDAAPVDTAP